MRFGTRPEMTNIDLSVARARDPGNDRRFKAADGGDITRDAGRHSVTVHGYHLPMFGMLRSWRRRRILARNAIPYKVWQQTVTDIPALSQLHAEELDRLRSLALLFLHEKSLEPADGLELDEAMRVRIAALACRPILELGLDYYNGFVSVIVYPQEFLVRDREHVDEAGVVHTRDEVLSGEAWEQGPVILAWQEVEASGRGGRL